MTDCSVLQLAVYSSRGSGCGFVVVAVLFSLFCFSFSFLSEWTGRLLLTAWTWPVDLSIAKAAGHCVFGHPRCRFIRTVMPFELLLYHKLIFAFFGFAVCSSCQNRSLFLCIVKLHQCNKRHTQDSSKDTPNLLLQQISVHSGGKERDSPAPSLSFAPD